MTKIIQSDPIEGEEEDKLLLRILRHKLRQKRRPEHFNIKSIIRKGSNDSETLQRLADKGYIVASKQPFFTSLGYKRAADLRRRMTRKNLGYED